MSRVTSTIFILGLFVAAGLLFGMGRKEAKEQTAEPVKDIATVKQGVAGRVEIWEGNFMPMVDPAKVRGQITPGAGRRVRIYEPVKATSGSLTSIRDSIPAPVVAEVVCDSVGQFFVPLETGDYSVFVEESGGWYFNGFDGKGVQGAVSVAPDSVSPMVIKITLKATH